MKDNALKMFEDLPDIFIEQFLKIAYHYKSYIALDNPSTKNRADYINESYNATNLLIKLIAIAANGEKIESQVKVPDEARFIYEAEHLKSESSSSPITTENAYFVYTTDMENWGIDQNSFAYKCMITITQVCTSYDSPIDAIHKVAHELDRSPATVASAFSSLVKKADFSKTQFVPKLKRIKPEEITKEILLKEYLSYCPHPEE